MKEYQNYRPMESGIETDFSKKMVYGDYLCLEPILSAQNLRSEEHDEMLFIIIHQASELWMKLVGVELEEAIANLHGDNFSHAFKVISRVKQVLRQLTQSWNILSTMTPVDYLKFRDTLGKSSGFQSYGYRKIEYLLGNKNAATLKVHRGNPDAHAELSRLLHEPSLYDAALRVLARRGFEIDASILERDFSQPYESNASVLQAWLQIYRDSESNFELYELAEKLVDVEDAFQEWRFKHMYTVQRIIGHRMGTGGSSGVGFLKKALDMSFFPELFELRTSL